MSQDTQSDVKAPYSNRKHKTTIRLNPELWAEFMRDVAAKDLSTCHVLEALISAWLHGGAMVPGLAQPLQLNLTMQHVVARPRRAGLEPTPPPVLFPHMGEWVYNRELQSLVKVAAPHK